MEEAFICFFVQKYLPIIDKGIFGQSRPLSIMGRLLKKKLHKKRITVFSSNSLIDSAQNRNRTSDTRIFSPLLYQLSYLGFYKTGARIPLLRAPKLRGQDLNL